MSGYGAVPFDPPTETGLACDGKVLGSGTVTIDFGIQMQDNLPVQASILKNGETFKFLNLAPAGVVAGCVTDVEAKRGDHYQLAIQSDQPIPEGGVPVIGGSVFTYLDISGDLE